MSDTGGWLLDDDEAIGRFNNWLRKHDLEVKRIAWYEGASSRQCHCAAYEEGECACGMYPSEPNPYRALSASAVDGSGRVGDGIGQPNPEEPE